MRALFIPSRILLAHIVASYVCLAAYIITWSHQDEVSIAKVFRNCKDIFWVAPKEVFFLLKMQFEVGGERDDYLMFIIVTAAYLIALLLSGWLLFYGFRVKRARTSAIESEVA
jgi:hypothetical protein